VAATACQGRHETPGTQIGRPKTPQAMIVSAAGSMPTSTLVRSPM
jgi:hypothetical protein